MSNRTMTQTVNGTTVLRGGIADILRIASGAGLLSDTLPSETLAAVSAPAAETAIAAAVEEKAPASAARPSKNKYTRPNGETFYARKIKFGDRDTTDVDVIRDGIRGGLNMFLIGLPGCGKSISLDTPVLTTNGWIPAADVKPGSMLIGRDGQPTTVLAIHPQPIKALYHVTFSDGVVITACGEHLWQVRGANARAGGRSEADWQVLTTDQILSAGLIRPGGRKQWEIPMLTAPVEFTSQVALPLDAYTLGVVLGDGKMAASTKGAWEHKPTSTTRVYTDREILDAIGAENIVMQSGCWLGTVQVPNVLGLRGLRSWEKFIPAQYLTASPADRLALLQGLLDTDGSSGRASVEYSTTSQALAAGVSELARSLGGTVKTTQRVTQYTYKGEILPGRVSYRVIVKLPAELAPFRLARKAAGFTAPTKYPVRRFITAIEAVEPDVSVCFTVDAPDALFVIDGYVVTHNTAVIEAAIHDWDYCHGMETMVCTGSTVAADFTGVDRPQPDGTFLRTDGPLVTAMLGGKGLYVDEIGRVDPKELVVLYSVMDGRDEITIPEDPARGVIKAQPGFFVIASTNPDAPGCIMDDALLSRFASPITYTTDYGIAVKYLGVPSDVATLARDMTKAVKNGTAYWAPTMRSLLQWRDAEKIWGARAAWLGLIGNAPVEARPEIQQAIEAATGMRVSSDGWSV